MCEFGLGRIPEPLLHDGNLGEFVRLVIVRHVLRQRLVEFELGLVSATALPSRPGLIRVSTLLDVLSRRIRSPAEQVVHVRLQADAERALAALLVALGDLDEQPLRMAIRDRFGPEDAT